MDKVILKSKDRKLKHSIQINRKVLWQKSLGLSQINFLVSFLFARIGAMITKSYQMSPAKNSKKIHSTWFWKNAVNIKVTLMGKFTKYST